MIIAGKAVGAAMLFFMVTSGSAHYASAETRVNQITGNQSAVPQLSQGATGPAYIEQMPAGARPRPAPAPARSKKPAPTARAAASVGKPGENRREVFPSVGAGVAMVLVAPASDGRFPSVGFGTVNR